MGPLDSSKPTAALVPAHLEMHKLFLLAAAETFNGQLMIISWPPVIRPLQHCLFVPWGQDASIGNAAATAHSHEAEDLYRPMLVTSCREAGTGVESIQDLLRKAVSADFIQQLL